MNYDMITNEIIEQENITAELRQRYIQKCIDAPIHRELEMKKQQEEYDRCEAAERYVNYKMYVECTW